MGNLIPNLIIVDIGSSKIAALACHKDNNDKISVIDHVLFRMENMVAGDLKDITKAGKNISKAIYELEKKCNISINSILVTFAGANTKSYYTIENDNLLQNKITKANITELVKKSIDKLKIIENTDIIHYIPLEFCLDNTMEVANPIGMIARNIESKLHFITAKSTSLANINNCLANYQIEVSEFFSNNFAINFAVLDTIDQTQGVIVIDLGSNTTSFTLFNNKPIYCNYIDIGGYHITQDIATVLSIDFDLAEKIKILHGNMLGNSYDREMIINFDNIEPININILNNIIKARIEEIFTLIKNQYDFLNIDYLVKNGVVITGGGANLLGVEQIAKKIFNRKAKVANIVNYQKIIEHNKVNFFASALGVVEYKNRYISEIQKHDVKNGTTKIKKIINWIKNNF